MSLPPEQRLSRATEQIITEAPDASVLTNGNEKYTILGVIENIKNGHVLCARNEEGEDVAIKVIHKADAYSRRHGRESIAVEQRILRQVTELGKPFLTQLLSSWDDQDNVYLVMRLYYTSLLDRLRKMPLSPQELELCIAELVSALCSLHAANIMHRDIKAENILISPSGRVFLSDFGLAFTRPSDDIHCRTDYTSEDLTVDPEPGWDVESSTLVGTAGYMAPEVITLTPESCYSRAADVWSLGMTLLEVAVDCEGPYYIADRKDDLIRLMMTYDPPPEWIKDFQLRDLLSKMLKRGPYQRWTAEQLKKHPFFDGMDWDLLESGGYYPMTYPEFPVVDPRRADSVLWQETAAQTAGNTLVEAQLELDEVDEGRTFSYRCPDHLKLMQDHLHGIVELPVSSDEETLEDEEMYETNEQQGSGDEKLDDKKDQANEMGEGTTKDNSTVVLVFGAEVEEECSVLEVIPIMHVEGSAPALQHTQTTRPITLSPAVDRNKNEEVGPLQALRSVPLPERTNAFSC